MKKEPLKVVLVIHPDDREEMEALQEYIDSCNSKVEHRTRTFFNDPGHMAAHELATYGGFRQYLYFMDPKEAVYAKMKWGGNQKTLEV